MPTLKNFYRYVFGHKFYFFAYLILAGLSQILGNLHPFFLKWITSSLLISNYQTAMYLVLGSALVLIGNTILYTLSMLVSDRSALKSSIDLQMEVMRKIHDLDFSYHTEKSSGRLISIMKRGEDAFLTMYDVLNRELYFILISLGFMIYAFSTINIKYVVVSAVAIAISSFFTFFLIKLNLKTRRRFTDIDDSVSAARVDNLINFDTVKYFAKESYEQNRLLVLLGEWYVAGQKYFNTFRYFDLSIGNLSNLAIAGTLLLSIIDLRSKAINLPEFILISSFSVTFFPKLNNIVMTLRQAAKRFSDLEQYLEVLQEKITVKDADNPQYISKLNGHIVFDRMTFFYHVNNPVFSEFSLNISPGESVALVGLSGSGKTTLIKLLMRMYDIQSGSISIDDVNINNMAKTYLRSLIGIVPQDPLMFNHTIRYNVGYANPDVSDEEIWSALDSAHLGEFVHSLPEELQTAVGERGIKLSGGQRQRLAIARVLLENPKIIVLDEATSSLDSESEGAIQDSFWNLVKNPAEPKTSIIIAHRLSTVMRTDRIIVLKNGTIAEAGAHKSLLKRKNGIYLHLWNLQQNGFLADLD